MQYEEFDCMTVSQERKEIKCPCLVSCVPQGEGYVRNPCSVLGYPNFLDSDQLLRKLTPHPLLQEHLCRHGLKISPGNATGQQTTESYRSLTAIPTVGWLDGQRQLTDSRPNTPNTQMPLLTPSVRHTALTWFILRASDDLHRVTTYLTVKMKFLAYVLSIKWYLLIVILRIKLNHVSSHIGWGWGLEDLFNERKLDGLWL